MCFKLKLSIQLYKEKESWIDCTRISLRRNMYIYYLFSISSGLSLEMQKKQLTTSIKIVFFSLIKNGENRKWWFFANIYWLNSISPAVSSVRQTMMITKHIDRKLKLLSYILHVISSRVESSTSSFSGFFCLENEFYLRSNRPFFFIRISFSLLFASICTILLTVNDMIWSKT